MTAGILCFVVIQDLFKTKVLRATCNGKDETMQYLSTREMAEKWGVSMTLIKRLCNQGRIVEAVYKDGVWRIPEDAVRVERTILEHTEEPELPELAKKLQNQKKKRNFHGLYCLRLRGPAILPHHCVEPDKVRIYA